MTTKVSPDGLIAFYHWLKTSLGWDMAKAQQITHLMEHAELRTRAKNELDAVRSLDCTATWLVVCSTDDGPEAMVFSAMEIDVQGAMLEEPDVHALGKRIYDRSKGRHPRTLPTYNMSKFLGSFDSGLVLAPGSVTPSHYRIHPDPEALKAPVRD